MAARSDMAGIERRYLLDMLALGDGRILEIGCGDGRLTRDYAAGAAAVVGIDVAADDVRAGREGRLAGTVDFLVASGVDLPFCAGSFDQVIFTHSF